MTSKEIRLVEISSKDIVRVHELHLIFLQEIAAQLAELNEGSLIAAPVDFEPPVEEEGVILTGDEAVRAAELETEIHEAKKAVQSVPIFIPDAHIEYHAVRREDHTYMIPGHVGDTVKILADAPVQEQAVSGHPFIFPAPVKSHADGQISQIGQVEKMGSTDDD